MRGLMGTDVAETKSPRSGTAKKGADSAGASGATGTSAAVEFKLDPSDRPSFWRFLWPSIGKYRGLVLLALGLNALHGVSFAAQTFAPKYLIDQIILASGI